MDLSLVICTRNRDRFLAQALQSLRKIEGDFKWELVVVNNGSTDRTAEVLNQFGDQFSLPFQIVDEARTGLGRARNAGWQVAHGRVVAFTDDDCYPAPNYLSKILECFDKEAVGFVGGRILLYDPTDLPITIQPLDRSVEVLPGEFLPAGLIQGANFAFRRSALESVNGFDNRMGAGTPFACEDVDILARLLAKGYKGVYSPNPLIYHHHRRKTWADAVQLTKSYDYGRGAYYAKCLLHPDLRLICAKHWNRSFRAKNYRASLREIIGAVHFLSVAMFRRRPLRWPALSRQPAG